MRKTVVLTGYGYRIGKRSNLIVIRDKSGRKIELSTGNVGRIIAFARGLSISGDALKLILRHNIRFIIVSRSRPLGMLHSFRRSAPVKLIKEQVYAQNDGRAIYIAKTIIYGKLSNQINILRWLRRGRFRRRRFESELLLESYMNIMDLRSRLSKMELDLDDYRSRLINIEAEASRIYWNVISKILPPEIGFDGRRKRYERPRDVLNLSLNYLYTLLASEVWGSIELNGLDPWIGYLHIDSNRRPSLVMDLMEEFRQPVVDKSIIAYLLNYKGDYSKLVMDGRLSDDFLKELSKLFYESLKRKVTFNKYYAPIDSHVNRQARRLARYIVGITSDYKPFNII
ncbi:CRISPR-associated endonuclease Cas1 [Candidatus Geothermarchaeota archaeon]|nr:MAG: CRISPR-associated endonuclease Cas1 [Candidatus Geothermarchaeota archaeon]